MTGKPEVVGHGWAMEIFVEYSLTAGQERAFLLDKEWMPVAEAARLAAHAEAMRVLIAEAVEDETEFETEWNKAARAVLDAYEKGAKP